MSRTLAATAFAAFALGASPAMAQASQAATNQADLRCMAVIATVFGSMDEEALASDPEQMAGLSGGLMYYLGRLEGRSPETDWLEAFGRLLVDLKPEDIEANAPRCGKELEQAGGAMVAFGEKFQGKP